MGENGVSVEFWNCCRCTGECDHTDGNDHSLCSMHGGSPGTLGKEDVVVLSVDHSFWVRTDPQILEKIDKILSILEKIK